MIASRLYSLIEGMRSTTDVSELDSLYEQSNAELKGLYALLRTNPTERPIMCFCGGIMTLAKEKDMWVLTCKRCGTSVARKCTKEEMVEYWKERVKTL